MARDKRLQVVTLKDPITEDQMISVGRSAGKIFEDFGLWDTGEVVVIWQNKPGTKIVNIATFDKTNPLIATLIHDGDQMIAEKGKADE